MFEFQKLKNLIFSQYFKQTWVLSSNQKPEVRTSTSSLKVGLDDFRGVFQTLWFCDSNFASLKGNKVAETKTDPTENKQEHLYSKEETNDSKQLTRKPWQGSKLTLP